MKINKHLSMGIISAAMGILLIGGGTFAYFSDTASTDNTFAAGTVDLASAHAEILNLDSMKPGDSMIRTFELNNNGSLDLHHVYLDTEYTVYDKAENNSEDFGEHMEVEFIYNVNEPDEVIFSTTLAELEELTPEAAGEQALAPILGDGLTTGDVANLAVKFTFVDNGQDQNEFQGDGLVLEWTFTGIQANGENS